MKRLLKVAVIIGSCLFGMAMGGQVFAPPIHNEVAAIPGQRLVPIPKLSCKSAAEAILRAESKNPGWKAVKVTETKIAWNVTLKMK